MRYTVNYCGAVFTDDNEGFNCFETNDFQRAKEILYHIVQSGADVYAYLKDEKYQCTFQFDPRDNDFVWEG